MRSLLCDVASPLSVGEAKIIHGADGRQIVMRRVGRAAVQVTLDQRDLLFVRGPQGRLTLAGAIEPGSISLLPYDLDHGLLSSGAGAALAGQTDTIVRQVSESLVPLGAELVARYPRRGAGLVPWEGVTLYRLVDSTGNSMLYASASAIVAEADEPSGWIRCERIHAGPHAFARARASLRALCGEDVGAPIARG